MKAQIGRELDRLELLLGQIAAIEAERDAMLARQKKKMVVALARKLLVALWRYVDAEVVIEGAVLEARRGRARRPGAR